jgi:hypothetical protein
LLLLLLLLGLIRGTEPQRWQLWLQRQEVLLLPLLLLLPLHLVLLFLLQEPCHSHDF